MGITLDDAFWSGFSKGDSAAFKQVYDRYIDDLYTYGRKYTRDAELVKDAIHDLFTDLYKYHKTLSRPDCMRAYLLAALRRSIWRKLKNRPEHLSLEDAGHTPAFSISIDPETRYIDAEQGQRVQYRLDQAIRTLSSRQQEAIYLKYHAELSYEEISRVMGVTVATCRTLVYRAVKSLRSRLETPEGRAIYLPLILRRAGEIT